MGYSFTSPEVVSALVRAKRRGVDVKIVLDEKGNLSKTSQAAMNIVVNAGIQLRTNGHYAIMHDKIITLIIKRLRMLAFITLALLQLSSLNHLLGRW